MATSEAVSLLTDDEDELDDEFLDVAVARVIELECAANGARGRKRDADSCLTPVDLNSGDAREARDARERRATPGLATTNSSGAPGKKSRARVRVDVEHGAPNVREFVAYMQTKSQCAGTVWLESRNEDYTAPAGFVLDGTLAAVLARCGTAKLYSHQSAAIKAARSGKSVVVSTPTASGKSLCYVVPIFEAIMDEKSKRSKALLMFPLKALANDQLLKMRRIVETAKELMFEINETMRQTLGKDPTTASAKERRDFLADRYPAIDLKRLERLVNTKLAVCDGDTDDAAKAEIKKQGTHIILTNPDSLHHAMLPGHKSWGKKFWGCLRYIVLDEAHTHTGVSGSHVANVLRRLLRVCSSWDPAARPEFICTSATISNPVAHVRRLTTRTPVCVNATGAPSGEKAMILWQPPEADQTGGSAPMQRSVNAEEDAPGTQRQRRSPYAEAADIVAELVQRNIRCLVFVSSRTSAETLSRDAKGVLSRRNNGMELAQKVDCYRAGYNQAERRALERRLQRGDISALVCTSALEMGIDVGALDATVHVGVPETASAMWQQAGRAGRRQGASVAVVIANEKPLDHYYVTRPDELFKRQSEEALVDPHNVAILELHLPCAAKEVALDLRGDDAMLFTTSEDDALRSAESAQSSNFKAPLHLAIKRALGTASSKRTCAFNKVTKTIECLPNIYPHRSVMLRGVQSGESWQLVDASDSLIEEVDGHRALARLYVGCVFLARSGQFMIERLDHDKRVAHAVSYARVETTTTRERTDIVALDLDPDAGVPAIVSRRVAAAKVCLGDVDVSEKVLGYVRNDHRTAKTLHEELWRAPVVAAAYRTRAVWFDLPEECVRRIAFEALREATNGVANILGGLVASVAMCDTRDVAGATYFPSAESGSSSARVFLYDTTPGGIGLAEKVFENIEALWRRALQNVKGCLCNSGCPSCIQAGRRGREAGFRKREAQIILDGLLGTWM